MSQLTDAIDAAIAAQNILIQAESDLSDAQANFANATSAKEAAFQSVASILPSDLLSYEYTDGNNNDWVVTVDNNPNVKIKILNSLP